MAAVRDLSTSDAVFKSVINNKLKISPSGVPSQRTEGLHKNMVKGRLFCNPSEFPPLFKRSLERVERLI